MKHIDGWLYGGMAACTALTASFQTDEAMNYIAPASLWYSRTVITTIGAVLLAVKTYRSTAFADNKAKVEADTAATTGTIQTIPQTIAAPESVKVIPVEPPK